MKHTIFAILCIGGMMSGASFTGALLGTHFHSVEDLKRFQDEAVKLGFGEFKPGWDGNLQFGWKQQSEKP